MSSQNETITLDEVKNWRDAKQLFRHWRDENIRSSKDIIVLWETLVHSNIGKFGDEKWLVYEQVYVAALDCNNLSMAKSCMYALKTQFPKSSRVNKLVGMFHEATGKFDKALEIYQDILEGDETNAHVRKRMISCLKSQNRTKEYINELNEYVKMFQADHEAWLELCDAYLSEMEFSKACFCIEELILMYPHNHVYHQRLADIKYTQGQYEVARNYYAYSLKLNPNNIRALYGILLSTTNLKNSQKSKESTDNMKLNVWAKEQLEQRYAEKKVTNDTTDLLANILKGLTLLKVDSK